MKETLVIRLAANNINALI